MEDFESFNRSDNSINHTFDHDHQSISSYQRPTTGGVSLAETIVFTVSIAACIGLTIVGNILVILSVFTYRPLRCVQNFYIVSLACADLAVTFLVMPFNVVQFVLGRWIFGAFLCNFWLTCDILTCTASILHLCAIAMDRYSAINNPIEYAQKRTLRRVLIGIGVVWLLSALISIPPLVGWNTTGGSSLYNPVDESCRLTDERGYVIYSAAGSFFIPLVIMTFVYVKIFVATRRRLRARVMGGFQLVPSPSRPGPIQPVGDEKISQGKCRGQGRGRDKDRGLDQGQDLSRFQGQVQDQDHGQAQDQGQGRGQDQDQGRGQHRGQGRQQDQRQGRGLGQGRPTTSDASGVALIGAEGRQPDDNANDNFLKIPPNPGGGDSAQRSAATAAAASVSGSGSMQEIHQFLEEKQRISLTKERRVARTMAVVMGAFVVCWLPFFLMYVVFPFCEACSEATDRRIVNFIVWLGYINSTLNPIIYTIFNVDFRRAFKFLLLKSRCCRIRT